MKDEADISGGFATVGAGLWLASSGQPAACRGAMRRRRRTGLFLRDRQALELVETSGDAYFSSVERPFLTHIPCVAPVFAVSSKVLLAPGPAWDGAIALKPVPMGAGRALCVTRFKAAGEGAERSWVVAATRSRTARFAAEEGETVSVRPECIVAWIGARPTGSCRKIGVLDLILPRMPRDVLFDFHGPCTVWIEGAACRPSAFYGRRAAGRLV